MLFIRKKNISAVNSESETLQSHLVESDHSVVVAQEF